MKYEIELPNADDAALWDIIKNEGMPGPPDQFGRRSPVPKYNGVEDFIAEIVGQRITGTISQRAPTPEMLRLAAEIEERNLALNQIGRPVVRKKAGP